MPSGSSTRSGCSSRIRTLRSASSFSTWRSTACRTAGGGMESAGPIGTTGSRKSLWTNLCSGRQKIIMPFFRTISRSSSQAGSLPPLPQGKRSGPSPPPRCSLCSPNRALSQRPESGETATSGPPRVRKQKKTICEHLHPVKGGRSRYAQYPLPEGPCRGPCQGAHGHGRF